MKLKCGLVFSMLEKPRQFCGNVLNLGRKGLGKEKVAEVGWALIGEEREREVVKVCRLVATSFCLRIILLYLYFNATICFRLSKACRRYIFQPTSTSIFTPSILIPLTTRLLSP